MATQFLTVTYDTTTFSPTPIVNYTQNQIDFGYVYGYNTDITLEGLYTGIDGTTATTINFLTGAFNNQFKTLEIKDNGTTTIYSWPYCTVDSISLDTNPYFSGSFVRYTIKLKSYSIPSGVIDPSNEYSFSQNEDSTVNVQHRISARGVRNNSGAFENAVAFVRQFTGKDAYSNCAPLFIPNGSGILTSISETINRAEGIYSVSESYRYNTGVNAAYVKTATLEISDLYDAEYRTIDYNVKLQGSPVNRNLNLVVSGLTSITLTDISTEFGIGTTNWVKSSYSSNIDSGAATVDARISYVSGANPTGYFDYEVTCDRDFLGGTESWKVEGEFKCFGPLDFKRMQMESFRNRETNNWRNFATGLIIASPIYSTLHDSNKMFSPNVNVDVQENTQLATLRITANLDDGYEPVGLRDLKYSWEVNPSKWVYELMPSANIEGSYVIQDIQSRTRTRQKMMLAAKAKNMVAAEALLSGYLSGFANSFVSSGNTNNITAFKIVDEMTTGTYDVSASDTWLGEDLNISSGLYTLQSIGSMNDTAPLRPSGYSFGY